MGFPLIAIILWAAGFIGNAALFAVLVVRNRIRVVPWFTTWVVFNLLYSITLFAAYRSGAKHLYLLLYWAGAFLDLSLQVCMIAEIARHVLRRGEAWVHGAKKRLIAAGLVSVVLGTLMGCLMTPAATSYLEQMEARVDLGATVLITILFTAILVISQQLGLSWRSLVLREGYGVAAWSLFSFITDTFHAYWRTAGHFTLLEHLRVEVYLSALVYWITVFWLPENQPLVPSSEEKKSIESFLIGLK